jgi:hypothetical protein
LKDRDHRFAGVMRVNGGFRPTGSVSRADLAYSLVQSLGLEAQATSFTGSVRVEYDGKHIAIEDADKIPADLRGYVQLALDLNILNAYFVLEQGRFALTPDRQGVFPADAGRQPRRLRSRGLPFSRALRADGHRSQRHRCGERSRRSRRPAAAAGRRAWRRKPRSHSCSTRTIRIRSIRRRRSASQSLRLPT